MADTYRRKGGSSRRVLWLLALTLAAVVGLFVVRSVLAPPEGFLLGIAPLDDRAAIVTFRYNGDDEARSWAARIDASAGLLWYTELPLLAAPSLFDDGITVGEGVATVRVVDARRYEVVGLSLDDGELLWRTAIPDLTDTGLTLAWSTPRHLVEWNAVTGGSYWFGVDRQTGALLWHDRSRDTHGVDAAIWGDLLVRTAGDVTIVSTLDTGEERYRGTARGRGCLVDGDLYMPRVDGLYRFDLHTLQETVAYSGPLPDVAETADGPRTFYPSGCAPRGGLLVFWDPSTASLLAIDPDAGEIAWRLSLVDPAGYSAELVSIGEWSGAGPGNLARTPLPRFLVLGLETGGADTARLWVVDLDARRIVGRTAPDPFLIHYGLLRRAGRTYLWHGPDLVVFDGDSGRFDQMTQVGGMGEDLEPAQLRDDSLWRISIVWTRLDRAWWVVIDPETLELQAAGNPDVSTEAAPRELRARFALEPFEPGGWTAPAEAPAPGVGQGTGEGTGAP